MEYTVTITKATGTKTYLAECNHIIQMFQLFADKNPNGIQINGVHFKTISEVKAFLK
jgi:hypothetical protein